MSDFATVLMAMCKATLNAYAYLEQRNASMGGY